MRKFQTILFITICSYSFGQVSDSLKDIAKYSTKADTIKYLAIISEFHKTDTLSIDEIIFNQKLYFDYIRFGDSLLFLNRTDEAKDFYKKAHSLFPKECTAYFYIAKSVDCEPNDIYDRAIKLANLFIDKGLNILALKTYYDIYNAIPDKQIIIRENILNLEKLINKK